MDRVRLDAKILHPVETENVPRLNSAERVHVPYVPKYVVSDRQSMHFADGVVNCDPDVIAAVVLVAKVVDLILSAGVVDQTLTGLTIAYPGSASRVSHEPAIPARLNVEDVLCA